jgi:hypothetical protein
MSWNFTVEGQTKEEAKAAIMGNQNVKEWKYCPIEIAEGICRAIDGLAEPQQDAKLVVFTHGHVTAGGGGGKKYGDSANVSISYTTR